MGPAARPMKTAHEVTFYRNCEKQYRPGPATCDHESHSFGNELLVEAAGVV